MSVIDCRRALLASTLIFVSSALHAQTTPTNVAPATEAGAEPTESDTIVVTGSQPKTQASAGTKSATPILETPQSVSVITSDQIVGLGQQNLNEALRFVAGVTPEQRGASAEVYDQFKIRGFDAPVYLDGLKQFGSASGYAVQQVDLSRIDRIEIIKGPASALYGQSGPGGLVAEDSKTPLDRNLYGAIAGTYGNYNLYRVDGDIGGRISDDVLWRLYGSVNGAHDEQKYGYRRRENVSGAVTLGAGTPTSMTVIAAYSHDPRNGNYGVFPAVGTFFDQPNGRIPTKFYGGEPNDFFKREQFGITYIFNHDFGDGWNFRTLGRYQYVSSHLGIVYTGGFPVDATQAAPTLYSRSSYSTIEKNNAWSYDNQLTKQLRTGPVTHDLLIGADRQVAHSNELYAFGGATPIDAYDPVYGTMPTPHDPADVPAGPFGVFGGHTITHQRQQSIYAQDQIAVAGLRVTLSGRHDWARSTTNGGTAQKDEKWTYRVGGLYKFDFGLAPYVSYATSFEPVGGTVLKSDGTFGAARPTTGKQLEAGAKYQVPGTDILLTAAWFRIIQDNLIVAGPIPNTSIQGGRIRSKGVEVEATAPLPYGFNAKLAFSRQRTHAIDGTTNASVLGVGRGGLSANLEWAPKDGALEGLVVGGAVRHVDKADAGTYNDGVTYLGNVEYRTPSYTVYDALLRYDLGKFADRLQGVSVAVNAKNILDKKYLTTCYLNYGWCWYGNRRTIQGTIGYKF